MTGPNRSPREIVMALIQAQLVADWDALRALVADDYVEDYPQSGERVRGADAALAVRRQFPGVPEERIAADVKQQAGGEDRWALAPNFQAVRMTADGDTVTVASLAQYPDGPWYVIAFIRVAGGKVAHTTMYFAPMLPAPDWRREFVEQLPDSER